MKVYILQIDWRIRCESGHDIVRVFGDEQKANIEFIEFLFNERCNTWLGDYVDDKLKPLPDAEFDEYDFSDTHFCAESYAYDARTEVWIESFDVE